MARRGAPMISIFFFMGSRLLQTAPCSTIGPRFCGQLTVAGKESHRACKSKAAEPSQPPLCSMCEKDDSQDESQNRCGNAVVSRNDCADHFLPPSVPCIATALSSNAAASRYTMLR